MNNSIVIRILYLIFFPCKSFVFSASVSSYYTKLVELNANFSRLKQFVNSLKYNRKCLISINAFSAKFFKRIMTHPFSLKTKEQCSQIETTQPKTGKHKYNNTNRFHPPTNVPGILMYSVFLVTNS